MRKFSQVAFFARNFRLPKAGLSSSTVINFHTTSLSIRLSCVTKDRPLLSKLGRAIAGIPLRATLVIVGDFQAEVKPAIPHVGRSTCNTPFHTGAEALDPDALNTCLESYGLTALNTWCGPPQPTQFNQAPNNKTGTSQIDFIITRLTTAE